MKWLFLAFALSSFGPTVRAQDAPDPATGNGYLEICARDDDTYRTACTLYTAGMHNMVLMLEILGQLKSADCSPDTTTIGEKRDRFIAYLKVNPALRHLGSPLLYLRAMAEAFPCPSD
jgi:Ssp1 endopeptidase immunity protein Rap1a